MLIMVFVFGCVQFAYAETTDNFVYGEEASKYISSSGKMLIVVKSKNEYFTCFYSTTFITPVNRRIALLRRDNGDCYSFDVYLENNSVVESGMVSSVLSRQETGKSDITTSFSSSYGPVDDVYLFNGQNINSFDKAAGELVSAGCPVFDNKEDLNTYLNTGDVNNPIYDNRPIEYDETIEIPLMAQCQVNGDSFLFNCKQSVAHSDYTIQLSADCRLTPVYSNFASKSYADTKQSYRTNKNEIGKYDNHGVSFNTSFSTSDLLNGVDTSRKALGFKEFYNGIYINLPYEKCTLSEIVFYARNICGNKCSNWVRVTYDLVNETSKYEEIESVTGSDVPSDTKHNNSEYYPDDYLYNDDEAFNSSSNISNTLTNLKSNYTSLANFYKELFSFLPSEIWILLIGLVGTMVVIAIVIFVRG